MAEVFVGRLKFQLPSFLRRIRQQIKDRTQQGVAMAVQINRYAIPGTHQGPGFLDVGHKTVIQAQQRTEIDRQLLGQLPVQPLKRIHAMQLFQAGMAQQIPGEVVAIAELGMLIHLGIELLQLLLHGCVLGGPGARSTCKTGEG